MKNAVCKQLFVVMLAVLVVLCTYFASEDLTSLESVSAHMEGDLLSFSESSGYYEDSLKIKLSKTPELLWMGDVFYTTDGTDPRETGQIYSGPILLEKQSGMLRVVELKAVVFYRGEFSKTFSQTYFIGDSVSEYYGLPVVHISTDPGNLYDHETGIFVPGAGYEQALAAGKEGWNARLDANFYKEGEGWNKESLLTVLDADGTVLTSQPVFLTLTGNTSRWMDIKSLKVIADENSNIGEGKLTFSLYNTQCSPLSMVGRYNSLRLRSGAQDQFVGNIRSSVAARLAELSNFDGTPTTNRCVVYINGSYYGLFDIQQNYSPSFLRNRFGLPGTQNIEEFKGGEAAAIIEAGIQDLLFSDMALSENRALLEKSVDVENLLTYYAINLLMNNTDWPQNNLEIWRYTGGYDGTNPYTDGRFRFLIYDTDLIWYNAYDSQHHFDGDNVNMLSAIMNDQYRAKGSFFSNLMKAEEYRHMFLTIICDLQNTAFAEDQVLQIVAEESDKILLHNQAVLNADGMKAWNDSVEMMRQGIMELNRDWPALLEQYFSVSEQYTLTVENQGGVALYWSNQCLLGGEKYSVSYFKGVSFTLRQQPYAGYRFEHWLVNGEPVYGDTLTITAEMAQGYLKIQTVTTRLNTVDLLIQEVCARGDSDWIRLTNHGLESIDLTNYYISDSTEELLKYQLPQVVLEPGASVVINGAKNYYVMGSYICNFNLSEGETLFLSQSGQIVDQITVPRMDPDETYGRHQDSNEYFYFDNRENIRYLQY